MQTAPKVYLWTYDEYERLGEAGFLGDRHFELVGGQIVEMSPTGPRHEVLTSEARMALEAAFLRVATYVREEKTLVLGEWDAPQPDLVVVIGLPRDYLTAHPTVAQTLLVVEVADTTLAYDLGDKADRYAAAGIEDYWVSDVNGRRVWVLRRPSLHPDSPTGHRYGERRAYAPGESVVPLAAPDNAVPVAAMLP